MATPPVGIGDVIAGKFVVERVIGEGGMGVVVSAHHRELEQRVAIKFLLSEFAEQGMAAERFRREARAAAKMRGEHVCRVLDVGTLESGVPYMVMEYLDGRDLASELQRRGRLPVEEAVGYVLEACEALAEAHGAGIIHRDLKPANLFLETRNDGSRRIKVLDFGVSKSLLDIGSGRGALTKTSSLVGSPLYMSPEQLDSAKDVDGRTDVWSLGVVLYELVTGGTPFNGETIPQLVAAVLQDTPLRLSAAELRVAPGLVEVVQHALAKPRDKRFASVVDFAQALAPFASPAARMSVMRVSRLREPSVSTPNPDVQRGEDASAATVQSSRPSSTPLAWDRNPRRPATRVLWTAAGVLALLLVGAAGFLVLRGRTAIEANAPRDETPPAAVGTAPLPASAPASVIAPSAPGTLDPAIPRNPGVAAAVTAAKNEAEVPAPAPDMAAEGAQPARAPAATAVDPKAAASNPAPARPQPSAAVPRARPGAELDPKPTHTPAPTRGGSVTDFGGRR